MKTKYIFIFLLICSSVYSQNKMDRLVQSKSELSIKIKTLTDSLNIILNEIQKEENLATIAQFDTKGFSPIDGSILFTTNMYNAPSIESIIIKSLPAKSKVRLIGLSKPSGEYFKIDHLGRIGYVSNTDIVRTPEVIKFESDVQLIINEEKRQSDQKEANLRKLDLQKKQKQIQEKNKIENSKRRSDLINKYGNSIALKILNNEIWIGMSSEIARESLGTPKDINRTVTASVIREQWVYHSKMYLYFENNVLISWQD